jgi:partner of Y14 and mago protein
MSLTSRRKTGDGDTTSAEEKETILPSTVRADGSVRKPVRIRAGYVNQFEVKKYVSPALRKQQQEEKEEGEEKREEERTASSAKSSTAGTASSLSSNASSNNSNNSNNMTAAQKKNAKRREKKRLEAQQQQQQQQQQGEREKIKEEREQGEANDEEQEYLKTEIKHLRKQLQQCERIERKRMEDESKVRPSEWEKLGEYDETVDALEKLQRDLANLQFPAPEETKRDPKE